MLIHRKWVMTHQRIPFGSVFFSQFPRKVKIYCKSNMLKYTVATPHRDNTEQQAALENCSESKRKSNTLYSGSLLHDNFFLDKD